MAFEKAISFLDVSIDLFSFEFTSFLGYGCHTLLRVGLSCPECSCCNPTLWDSKCINFVAPLSTIMLIHAFCFLITPGILEQKGAKAYQQNTGIESTIGITFLIPIVHRCF